LKKSNDWIYGLIQNW